MLGASISGFATPFALGYARHVRRSGPGGPAGRAAVLIAGFEALVCLFLAGGWLWSRLA